MHVGHDKVSGFWGSNGRDMSTNCEASYRKPKVKIEFEDNADIYVSKLSKE
ncbi:Hypothetical predicted protein [Olea europaea subsp. europaea]|uniref:Uncharacterized protein n=1 Tax=Olea europaea subsp. europaea TaxID=158383 RepID=A0A8S0TY66_OLEEU|nr:Hypothetical predicted protein [Olea europaea subsp. europaea]